jgi:translation initiation factor IF-3
LSNFRSGLRRGKRPYPPQSPDVHKINQRITAREVRVIDAQGEQAGVLSLRDALALAEESGLDLVEVAPNSRPPVCKVMDYGKFKYRAQKKEAEARKKRTDNTVKELRIRYRTDSGDLETKLKRARTFLEEGDKVKFSMRFKGREVMYVDLGNEKFQLIIDQLADVASVDERSPLSGRQIYIVLAPTKAPIKKKPTKEPTKEKETSKSSHKENKEVGAEAGA